MLLSHRMAIPKDKLINNYKKILLGADLHFLELGNGNHWLGGAVPSQGGYNCRYSAAALVVAVRSPGRGTRELRKATG